MRTLLCFFCNGCNYVFTEKLVGFTSIRRAAVLDVLGKRSGQEIGAKFSVAIERFDDQKKNLAISSSKPGKFLPLTRHD